MCISHNFPDVCHAALCLCDVRSPPCQLLLPLLDRAQGLPGCFSLSWPSSLQAALGQAGCCQSRVANCRSRLRRPQTLPPHPQTPCLLALSPAGQFAGLWHCPAGILQQQAREQHVQLSILPAQLCHAFMHDPSTLPCGTHRACSMSIDVQGPPSCFSMRLQWQH